MATLSTAILTLLDWAKRLDPDGKVPEIAELLSQTNEILADMMFMEGNLPTGHVVTVRTGLPTVFWRLLNQGVQPSKSTTTQIQEGIGIMEAWSEVDEEVAELNGNTASLRLSEAEAFLEAMNIEAASTIFYGNSSVAREEFNGLSVRYSDPTAAVGRNMINGGGAGADNTSIWLVVWGKKSAFGIFPKGSQAGIRHKDLGLQTVESANGIGGAKMLAYRDQWKWKLGLVLKDWRYAVRICNIDVSELAGNTPAAITNMLIKATHKLPTGGLKAGKPAIYMNRSVFQYLDIQRRADVQDGGQLSYQVVDGVMTPAFRGIPIRVCDALLDTEGLVSGF